MLKKFLIVLACLYLVGIGVVGTEYAVRMQSDEMSLADQLARAVKVGVSWPFILIHLTFPR